MSVDPPAGDAARPWAWLVGSVAVVLASGVVLYVIVLFLALGAGGTWGGYGEAAREPTASWFGPAVVTFTAVWLASLVVAVVLARRRPAWFALPFVVLAVLGLVGIALSRWWPG